MTMASLWQRLTSRQPYADEEVEAAKCAAVRRAAELEQAVYDAIPEHVRDRTEIGQRRCNGSKA